MDWMLYIWNVSESRSKKEMVHILMTSFAKLHEDAGGMFLAHNVNGLKKVRIGAAFVWEQWYFLW